MPLSKIPFVIERTEEKTETGFVFIVHPVEQGKGFTNKERLILNRFFKKEGLEPKKAILEVKDLKGNTVFIKGFKLYNLKSLLDFSYGEFHAE